MILNSPPLQALIFDYGNTLVEFAAPQIQFCDDQLGQYLRQTFGPYDPQRLTELRNIDRRSPYQDGYRENHPDDISTRLVQALYNRAPTPDQLHQMFEVRRDAFIQSVQAHPDTIALLQRLHTRYKIGLLSNYPCSQSIHLSLQRTSLAPHIDAIVVSADVGHVKPHPLPFTTLLDRLDVPPPACLFIGDNWLGDVQGAKRLGMKMAHITQYDTPERFHPQPDDLPPDLTLTHLNQLEPLLL